MKTVWKTLTGIAGAITGAIVCLAVASLIAEWLGGGSALGFGFVLLIAGPIALLLGLVFGVILALRGFRYVTEETSASIRKQRIWLCARLGLGIPVLVVSGAILLILRLETPPTDSQLIQNFERNEAKFERIVYWAKVNRVVENDNLLKQIGIPDSDYVSVSGDGSEDEVAFTYWSRGSLISNTTTVKEYIYLDKPPAPLVASLDTPPHQRERGFWEGYRHIKGKWYLYYLITDLVIK